MKDGSLLTLHTRKYHPPTTRKDSSSVTEDLSHSTDAKSLRILPYLIPLSETKGFLLLPRSVGLVLTEGRAVPKPLLQEMKLLRMTLASSLLHSRLLGSPAMIVIFVLVFLNEGQRMIEAFSNSLSPDFDLFIYGCELKNQGHLKPSF